MLMESLLTDEVLRQFFRRHLRLCSSCHVEFADTGIMDDEDVSLELGISDCSAVMGHGFIGRCGIWGSVEASNDLPYIWDVII